MTGETSAKLDHTLQAYARLEKRSAEKGREIAELQDQLATCRAINRTLWANASDHMARIGMLEEKLRDLGLRIPEYERVS